MSRGYYSAEIKGHANGVSPEVVFLKEANDELSGSPVGDMSYWGIQSEARRNGVSEETVCLKRRAQIVENKKFGISRLNLNGPKKPPRDSLTLGISNLVFFISLTTLFTWSLLSDKPNFLKDWTSYITTFMVIVGMTSVITIFGGLILNDIVEWTLINIFRLNKDEKTGAIFGSQPIEDPEEFDKFEKQVSNPPISLPSMERIDEYENNRRKNRERVVRIGENDDTDDFALNFDI